MILIVIPPSKAPLAEDCCSCVILAELCASSLICGQAAWEDGAVFSYTQEGHNQETYDNSIMSGLRTEGSVHDG
jgi:hypothetical protein